MLCLIDERLAAHSFSLLSGQLGPAQQLQKDAPAPNNQATNLTTDHAGKQRSKASNKNTTNKKENDVILLKKGNNYLYLLPKI